MGRLDRVKCTVHFTSAPYQQGRKQMYTNSLVNADLFYTNFTNTTFQKDRLFPRTKSRVNQGVGVFDNEIKTGFHYCFL